MSTLVRKNFGDNASYFCPYWSFHHRNASAVENHKKDCMAKILTNVRMPQEGSFVEFKDVHHTVFKPFAIYADCESRLEKVDVKKGNNTTQTQVHRNAGYCYRFVSRVDPSESCTVQYSAKTNEENVSDHFVKTLHRHVMGIGKKYAEPKPMVITEEEQAEFDAATSRWICGKGTVDGDGKLGNIATFPVSTEVRLTTSAISR